MKLITLVFATVLNIDCYAFDSNDSRPHYGNFTNCLAKQDFGVKIDSKNVDNSALKAGQELPMKRSSTENYPLKIIKKTDIHFVIRSLDEQRTTCDLITVISTLFLPLMALVLH